MLPFLFDFDYKIPFIWPLPFRGAPYIRNMRLFLTYVVSVAMNVLQVGHTLKLIDLDAAVSFKDGLPVGLKYSSAILPPLRCSLSRIGSVTP